MELRRTDAFDARLRGIADRNAKARINVAVVYFARRGVTVIVLLLCGAKTTQRADIVAAQSMVAQL